MNGKNVSIPTITRDQMVAAEVAKLPKVFRLRGFPGEYFRPDERDSFVNDNGGVTIYLHVQKGEKWVAHSKGSLREILGQLVEVSGDRRFDNVAQVEEFLRTPEHRVRDVLAIGAASIDYVSHLTNLSHVDVCLALKTLGALESRGVWRLP